MARQEQEPLACEYCGYDTVSCFRVHVDDELVAAMTPVRRDRTSTRLVQRIRFCPVCRRESDIGTATEWTRIDLADEGGASDDVA